MEQSPFIFLAIGAVIALAIGIIESNLQKYRGYVSQEIRENCKKEGRSAPDLSHDWPALQKAEAERCMTIATDAKKKGPWVRTWERDHENGGWKKATVAKAA